MATIKTHETHAISWVDLAATDVDGAIDFYGGLFGWDSYNDGVTPYTIFLADRSPVAGVMALTPEMGDMGSAWSMYVNVGDADATIAAVEAGGGSVLAAPFEIPGDARIAVLADPAGAAICIMEGMADDGIKVKDVVGSACWFDCISRDVDASASFYGEIFGWVPKSMQFGDMSYTMFENLGTPTAGATAMPGMVPETVPSHWVVNFEVADADVAAAFVKSQGGTVTMAPIDTPFGRSCAVVDPWGASLSVIDRSRAGARVVDFEV